MSGPLQIALDVGTATTTLALGGAGSLPVVVSRPTPDHDLPVFLAKLLEEGRRKAPGSIGGTTVTVPEAWQRGDADGARAYERLRRTVLDELGWPRVDWLGQAACIAAAAIPRRRGDGPLLVCDAGARTLGAALCRVAGRAVQVTSVSTAPGAGGLAFDASVAASLPSGRLPEAYNAVRTHQGRRAAVVLPRAWSHSRYREAPVYRLDGVEITAGALITAFADTAEHLQGVLARVVHGDVPHAARNGESQDVQNGEPQLARRRLIRVAVAGRFGVFPLVSRVLVDALDLPGPPAVLGPSASVRGALLIAAGEVTVEPPERPAVALPLHRIRRGLIETASVALDPAADFAAHDGMPVLVEVPPEGPGGPFGVRVDGRDIAVPLPELPPGAYRVGLRPARTGPGVLVLSPSSGGEPRFCPIVPPEPSP